MRYVENPSLKFDATDFGARVVNGTLEVPSALFQVLQEGHCRGDLEKGLSLMESSPATVGSWLSLSPFGMTQAMTGLLKHLDGHLDNEFLDLLRSRLDGSSEPLKVAFGARRP